MKRILPVLMVVLACMSVTSSAEQWDAVPGGYDYVVGFGDCNLRSLDGATMMLGDTLTFEYWYKGPALPGVVGVLDLVRTVDPIEFNGMVFEAPGGHFFSMDMHYPSICWRTVTIDIPFYLIVDQEGNRRTDDLLLEFVFDRRYANETFRWEQNEYLNAVFLRNIRSYDTGRDIGYPVGGQTPAETQPVPEPGTLMMTGPVLLAWVGHRLRNGFVRGRCRQGESS